MTLNRATVIFIVGSILLGWLARWIWTPFMTILGSYVLIEVLVVGFLRFNDRQAFLSVIRIREWKIGAYRAYLMYVMLALLATGIAAWAQGLGTTLDQSFAGVWSIIPVLVWSVIIGQGLNLSVLVAYGEELIPPPSPQA